MELAIAALAVLSAALSPVFVILAMQRRDAALAEKLITHLRLHQATGDPVHILEAKLALEADKVKLSREQAAIRAAELMRQEQRVPGVR